jgi:hypothetical protein
VTVLLGWTGRSALSAQAATKPSCTTAEFRQFDFWVGNWEVRDSAGALAGHNTITKVLGGCVLHESWTGAGGSHGESFNIYDAPTRRWHQTWVDGNGLLLRLDGGWTGDRMVLSGQRTGIQGRTVIDRISWIPGADHSVRQLWESSRDGGKTWVKAFDGIYRKRPAS